MKIITTSNHFDNTKVSISKNEEKSFGNLIKNHKHQWSTSKLDNALFPRSGHLLNWWSHDTETEGIVDSFIQKLIKKGLQIQKLMQSYIRPNLKGVNYTKDNYQHFLYFMKKLFNDLNILYSHGQVYKKNNGSKYSYEKWIYICEFTSNLASKNGEILQFACKNSEISTEDLLMMVSNYGSKFRKFISEDGYVFTTV